MDIEAKLKQSSAGVSLASFRFDRPAGRPGGISFILLYASFNQIDSVLFVVIDTLSD